MKKKEEVEKLRTRIHRLNRDGHVTEKVTQQRQITEDLANIKIGCSESKPRPELVMKSKCCYTNHKI